MISRECCWAVTFLGFQGKEQRADPCWCHQGSIELCFLYYNPQKGLLWGNKSQFQRHWICSHQEDLNSPDGWEKKKRMKLDLPSCYQIRIPSHLLIPRVGFVVEVSHPLPPSSDNLCLRTFSQARTGNTKSSEKSNFALTVQYKIYMELIKINGSRP